METFLLHGQSIFTFRRANKLFFLIKNSFHSLFRLVWNFFYYHFTDHSSHSITPSIRGAELLWFNVLANHTNGTATATSWDRVHGNDLGLFIAVVSLIVIMLADVSIIKHGHLRCHNSDSDSVDSFLASPIRFVPDIQKERK
jgi:hypothetical protein